MVELSRIWCRLACDVINMRVAGGGHQHHNTPSFIIVTKLSKTCVEIYCDFPTIIKQYRCQTTHIFRHSTSFLRSQNHIKEYWYVLCFAILCWKLSESSDFPGFPPTYTSFCSSWLMLTPRLLNFLLKAICGKFLSNDAGSLWSPLSDPFATIFGSLSQISPQIFSAW